VQNFSFTQQELSLFFAVIKLIQFHYLYLIVMLNSNSDCCFFKVTGKSHLNISFLLMIWITGGPLG